MACVYCLYCAAVSYMDFKPRYYCSYHNVRLRYSHKCKGFKTPEINHHKNIKNDRRIEKEG